MFNQENFIRGYIVAALWAETDDDGEPLDDNHSQDDITPETMQAMRADCIAFQASNSADLDAYCEAIEYDPGQGSPEDYAGHDFWLTRNRHGAGYWDRGLGPLGERLSNSARGYGEAGIYPGDDGRLYS